jgi:hypothetical protein
MFHQKGFDMQTRVRFLSTILLVSLIACTGSLFAQSGQGNGQREFGLGQPATIEELPPGQLKRKLLELPPQARGKALKWLQDFSFPEADVNSLDVDGEGNILYVDTPVVPADGAAGAATAEAPPVTTLDDAFLLHSRPGAPHTVFIDFDGHVISGTAWNGSVATFYARAFDLDSNPGSFNDTERARISDVWHRVAEDLAPFDIDVTTEAPASFDRYTGRVLVTHNMDQQGTPMPHNSGGGVAYVNVYGLSNYHTYYSPALVYYNQLGGGVSTYVAEASSHEFGHNLGLSHDGTTSGTEYYQGLGNGLVSWAPIMGNSYYNNVTQWSLGEYPGANNTQDDLSIIDGKLGFDGDDHGDTAAAATALWVDGNGSVVSSNPELDPHGLLPENKGIIGQADDTDVFSFIAGAGTVSLTVTPAWDAFYSGTARRGANLDIQAELRDAGNALVAAGEPLNDTSATLNAAVGGGAYYLAITGVGNSVTPYSDFDSLGQYFINGTVPVGVADNTPPSPDPMAFASAPAAVGPDAISMSAVTASDAISAVQYNFRCTAGGAGCVSSGWQTSTSHTASGLAAATQYTFTVAARDLSGNETAASSPASATTDEPPPPPPFVNYTSVSDTPVAGSVSGSHTDTHSDNGTAQSITERESGGKPQSRYAYLEHRWNFLIGSGATVVVYAQAWRSGSNSAESFDLEYSLNGGNTFLPLLNIAATSSTNLQSAALPGAPSGSVVLRVVDTHQQSGNRTLSTFHVDQLFIQVGTPASDPPDGDPANLQASAVSASEIALSWIDGSTNESGFRLERSLDGDTNWVEIATLPVGTESHTDQGLAAATQYFYRVSAFNGVGSSGYASASATTPVAPPPPDISLSASGYKVKGIAHIALQWHPADSVDVYRNGAKIATVSGGSYDDDTGSKGGGSYQHQVCTVGAAPACSNMTTTVF